jgi:hypothetical protein
MFILVNIFFNDYFFLFCFIFYTKKCMVTASTHGRKIATLELLEDHLHWLWNSVFASGISQLLHIGFKTIINVIVTALSER